MKDKSNVLNTYGYMLDKLQLGRQIFANPAKEGQKLYDISTFNITFA